MFNNHQLPLSVQPIISYPREAEVGKTYLMTIDLQTSGDDWPYEEEEYPIYCMLETSPLFSSKTMGEPAIVLHRFGGSYGAAQFLLTAAQEGMEGEIKVTLVNGWGVPVKILNLVDLRIKQELTRMPTNKVANFRITKPKEEQNNNININLLVKEIREKLKGMIQEWCGLIQVLNMTKPIELSAVYTNVNILEQITAHRIREITDLLKDSNFKTFERFGIGRIIEKRVSGLEAVEKYSNLIVLGKPGAGKTIFLKYIAMQCIEGNFMADLVPIFINIKYFAEATNKPTLLEYISQLLVNCRVTYVEIYEMFKHSKILVLLDGLDQVGEGDSRRVLKEIQDIYRLFSFNRFVITCRLATKAYTEYLEKDIFTKFSQVEVADFDDRQITTFANNWFKDKAQTSANFLQYLKENHRIYELTTTPLLLTWLCLVFEELGNFPANRSEFYEEGIDILLQTWNNERNIKLDKVYRQLTVKKKADLLSQIAWKTFEQEQYFFRQEVVVEYIADYLHLADADINLETLLLYSKAILRSIEAQHGLLVERAKNIYSFSHLTFHEYFTARECICSISRQLSTSLYKLVSHINESRWKEVFLLVTEMLPDATLLFQLMKQQIDSLLACDEKLQQFLVWVNQKSTSIEVPFKSVAVRALYFHLDLDRAHNTISARVSSVFELSSTLDSTFAITPMFDLDHTLYNVLVLARALAPELVNASAFNLDNSSNITPELKHSLQRLKEQIPNPYKDKESFNAWRVSQGQIWSETLRDLLIHHCNIGYDWQFSEQQKQLLKAYYVANQLLIECMNSDCYGSSKVREEIQNTLLLPLTELQREPL